MFDGNIIMAPALAPEAGTKVGPTSFVVSLANFLLPKNFGTMKIDPSTNCRNPNYLQYCQKDELFVKGRVKIGTLAGILDFLTESQQTFSSYDQPFMIIQGGKDKLIDPQVSFDLYSKSKTAESDK